MQKVANYLGFSYFNGKVSSFFLKKSFCRLTMHGSVLKTRSHQRRTMLMINVRLGWLSIKK